MTTLQDCLLGSSEKMEVVSQTTGDDPSEMFSPMSTASNSSPQTTTQKHHSAIATTAYLIGNHLFKNEILINALKAMKLQIASFEDANINGDRIDFKTAIFVFEEFGGPVFESLKKKCNPRAMIYGIPIVLEACRTGGKFPASEYPLFCRHLSGFRISVTGIKLKEELREIRRKIMYMDGTFWDSSGTQMTHLVTAKCRGNKYRDAVALGRPILTLEWIENLWKQRFSDIDPPTFRRVMELKKARAFYSCKIALDGFDRRERTNMINLVEQNGGEIVGVDDPATTHIVRGSASVVEQNVVRKPLSPTVLALRSSVDDPSEVESPSKRRRFDLDPSHVVNDNQDGDSHDKQNFCSERAKILRAEWFWSCIQIEACADETPYLLEQYNKSADEVGFDVSIGTPSSFTSPTFGLSDDASTPKSGTSGSAAPKRRKRMREFVSALDRVDSTPLLAEVVEESGKFNLGGKSLEQSQDVISDVEFASILKQVNVAVNAAEGNLKSMSPRHIEYIQLLQTERNYVTVLMNIVKNFKEPCENEEQAGGRILNSLEIKTIFHPVLAIYSLHRRMLRDIFQLSEPWNEENLIGQIYVKYKNELRKSYEPFINFFESIKNEIMRCEAEKPRFFAFLKIAQGRPECGKQTLADFMIRPVQRLPSTALILMNLAKHTPKTNPDADWIAKGLDAINKVNQTINEEKRRTEARITMFDTFHEIDGCPVELLSDHRSLLHKLDVTALTDMWGEKKDAITLCVFTDHIQVLKRRVVGGNKNLPAAASVANLSRASPATSRKSIMPHALGHQQKRYKFLEWIQFAHIKKIVDITDLQSAFAFVVRAPNEPKERHLAFTTPEDPDWTKLFTVTFFAKQVAGAVDRVDYEYLFAKADASALHISEGSSVFGKAAKFATKTTKKVSRALSITRSGTPSRLKRTVSQMMSPLFTSRHNPDSDSISQKGDNTTPLRNNLSSMSLWFGAKGGTMDPPRTPKARRALVDKDARKNIPCIQEN